MLERAITLEGAQGTIVGVLAEPEGPARAAVLIVAGQPQTRVGSHRMFVDLARGLAARGVASLRFDCGGWGDSPGQANPFEESARDIAAGAAFLSRTFVEPPPIWIWGLCDGASAAVLALPAVRAAGVDVAACWLVNPWVRSDASLSDAMVRTYYAKRIFQREFWARLLRGEVPFANLVAEPLRHLKRKLGVRGGGGGGTAEDAASASASAAAGPDLPSLLIEQLEAYAGTVRTVLSGDDLTAGETESLLSRDRRWRRRLERDGEILRVPGADHTFSRPEHWAAVIDWMAAEAGG